MEAETTVDEVELVGVSRGVELIGVEEVELVDVGAVSEDINLEEREILQNNKKLNSTWRGGVLWTITCH